jgi:hypothetical protein
MKTSGFIDGFFYQAETTGYITADHTDAKVFCPIKDR